VQYRFIIGISTYGIVQLRALNVSKRLCRELFLCFQQIAR